MVAGRQGRRDRWSAPAGRGEEQQGGPSSAGFDLEGFHPIAHSLSPFVSERPYEQLKDDFGYQGLGGTFVGCGGSYDYAAEGATHHAPADVALMLAIPTVVVKPTSQPCALCGLRLGLPT